MDSKVRFAELGQFASAAWIQRSHSAPRDIRNHAARYRIMQQRLELIDQSLFVGSKCIELPLRNNTGQIPVRAHFGAAAARNLDEPGRRKFVDTLRSWMDPAHNHAEERRRSLHD
ncbi:hypothetical protein ACFLEY_12220 [Bradyrhizobium sp. YCK136]|uniref:hypothetical protein n=1 Tax=Bradyrhizobium TaxID=374 RepID=UPI001B8D4DD1|nr:hypothetical protein [Bradyrhizobium diazoefficiens]MBR0865598.1 hypothetical protein [Bradyrhizobium diazoefficiens]MBR0890098.1 hypothetical protein [Bradyrhizobium diazoefficiens]MBR0921876.1 hypothetical protein [Bradyrhizobium diazoefficiens]